MARKQRVVEILIQGGANRATAAYDELAAKDHVGIDRILEHAPEDGLLRALMRIMS